MAQVPAATRTLRVLRYLASQPDPVPLDAIARACELPRSSAYHLVSAMVDEGFVVHLSDEHRYGLGVAAFEVGSGYARQGPLQRIARRPLAELVDRTGQSAHLAVLHGSDFGDLADAWQLGAGHVVEPGPTEKSAEIRAAYARAMHAGDR